MVGISPHTLTELEKENGSLSLFNTATKQAVKRINIVVDLTNIFTALWSLNESTCILEHICTLFEA